MDTSTLRSIVKASATGIPHARIWPNGLGFDLHGTQYVYNERTSQWGASRQYGDHAAKCGYGSTPDAAKRAAGIGRPEHRIRGGRDKRPETCTDCGASMTRADHVGASHCPEGRS